jgi:hypothetical protein
VLSAVGERVPMVLSVVGEQVPMVLSAVEEQVPMVLSCYRLLESRCRWCFDTKLLGIRVFIQAP